MVVLVGETLTGEPDKLPGIQAYDVAPVALILVLLPIQMEDGVLLALITGSALTVTVALELLLQPCELVPVTV